MAAQTFAQIEKIAAALPYGKHEDIAYRVREMIASAVDNANETIFVEKAAPEADFDAVAIASLESNLCFCDDEKVAEWFIKNGVCF